MRKKLGMIAIMMAMLVSSQITCYASTDTTVSTSTKNDIINENIINVESLSEDETVKMELGKEYILSCPIDKDWELNEIRLKAKSTTDWISIGKGEEENDYLEVKDTKTEQHRLFVKIICKSEILSIGIIIRNEKTKDTIEYTLDDVKVVKNDSHEKVLLVVRPKPTADDSGVLKEKQEPDVQKKQEENGEPKESKKPKKPKKPKNPEETKKPEESEKPEKPQEPEEPKEELIIIDTSGWKFEVVEGVYNGNEYTAIVTGLPDYVIPVYTNNTRTNAGNQTAYVTFEVPEGYAIPDGMETTISISKANIDAIELNKSWMLTNLVNGTIAITPPSSSVPKGVLCQYTVNGEEVGTSYTIDDTGIYSVEANFSLTEEMKQNYNLTNESSKAVFQVNPEMFNKSQYYLYLGELAAPEGQKKVEIWFEYPDDTTFSAESVQWHLQYDNNVLELVNSTKGSNMTVGDQRPNGYGYTAGKYYTWATLLELTFNVLDPNATDIVINLTDIMAAGWANTDFQQANTNGAGIVLNQTSNIIGVTLPTAQSKRNRMKTPKDNVDPVDASTETPKDDVDLVDSNTETSIEDVDLVDSNTETPIEDVDPVDSNTETPIEDVDPVDSNTETPIEDVDLVDSNTETSIEDADLVDSNAKKF